MSEQINGSTIYQQKKLNNRPYISSYEECHYILKRLEQIQMQNHLFEIDHVFIQRLLNCDSIPVKIKNICRHILENQFIFYNIKKRKF